MFNIAVKRKQVLLFAENTLDPVIAVFNKGGRSAFSAIEVGGEIGISRTTARKYLEYLIAKGLLYIHLDYGTKGRPERRYRLEKLLE